MLVFLLVALSVFAAIIPMVLFLGLVWWLDRYDREPLWMVLLTFLWGALGGAGLSLVGNTTIHMILAWILGWETAGTVTPVVVAPLVEEPTKALFLLLIARSRYFDNTTDGFVYGAAAGLGFGMTENFLYFYQVAGSAGFDPVQGTTAWAGTVVIRTFYSAVMHATATAITGAAMGLVHFRGLAAKALVMPLGLGVAMGIHALWNGMLTADGVWTEEGTLFVGNLVLFPLEFAATLVVFLLCVQAEKRTLVRELREEAAEGVLPDAHVAVISSYLARSRSRLLPAGKPEGDYVRLATTLAFRKQQARSSRGEKARFYNLEIERIRREIRGILAL